MCVCGGGGGRRYAGRECWWGGHERRGGEAFHRLPLKSSNVNMVDVFTTHGARSV